MDLRAYYRKIRNLETEIAEAFAVVVSVATPDGGRAGTLTEVPRGVAARMVVEGAARLASAAEAAGFQAAQAEAVRIAAENATAGRVQVSVVSTSELNELKAAVRSLHE